MKIPKAKKFCVSPLKKNVFHPPPTKEEIAARKFTGELLGYCAEKWRAERDERERRRGKERSFSA